MNPNILVAAITAFGSVVIAVTALLLGSRAFNSIERHLKVIETDVEEFFKVVFRGPLCRSFPQQGSHYRLL